ncbi:MAG: hypothetical protein AVDCRST_MAG19-96, partial [uncultured Thermomicrobiales bacterium]
ADRLSVIPTHERRWDDNAGPGGGRSRKRGRRGGRSRPTDEQGV